jgi:hypothetical protein
MEQFLSNEESQAASRFLMALERLLAFASENDTQLGTDELEFLIARVKAARTGFPLLQEERPAQQVDRLGSVLLGPVYTPVKPIHGHLTAKAALWRLFAS